MSTPAFAQEEEAAGPLTLSGGIAVTSDYRFRGISLSNEKVAVQPTQTVSHESGFYAGVWGSSLPDSPAYGMSELDEIGRASGGERVGQDVGIWGAGDY